MTIAVPHPLSLEQFLKLPYIEDSPAWEFINGEAIQKPMPGGKHSRLQSRLAGAINAAGSYYEAFPELRCTFGGRSIVPDLAVVGSDSVPSEQELSLCPPGLSRFYRPIGIRQMPGVVYSFARGCLKLLKPLLAALPSSPVPGRKIRFASADKSVHRATAAPMPTARKLGLEQL